MNIKPATPLLDRDRYCLFRIAEPERKKLEKLVFQRHPSREWGSFFRFGFRRTAWGLAASFIETLPPQAGDLDRFSPVVEFHPNYLARALREHEAGAFGIGVVHSHPQRSGVSPSFSDDDLDLYFADMFQEFGGNRPYGSLILNRNEDETLRFTGRVFDYGRWMPVTTLFGTGFPLLKVMSSDLISSKATADGEAECEESVTARLDQLMAERGRKRLRSARVGIIGCSGTGSPAIEALARAQVGEFVLVDHDRFSPSNLERLHGSSHRDVVAEPKPPKVEIMTRLIREVNPTANITALVGNALDPEVMDQLLRCDMVLGCTDTQHGRAALGDLAIHYLVPSLDVGVLMKGEAGKVTSQLVDITRYEPHQPCPFCSGVISNWWLRWELMDAEEREQRKLAAEAAVARGVDGGLYWGGDAPQLPTVGYLTTNAGSLAAGYAINWLTGVAAMPHTRFQYDLGAPCFGFVEVPRLRNPECSCSLTIGYGDQADASVTRPAHFPKVQRLRSDSRITN